MIFFDVTKTGHPSHRSGLTRVSSKLRGALGDKVREVTWDSHVRSFKTRDGAKITPRDWLLSAELFSDEERPGLAELLAKRPCRLAAVFHDAIPLKHPHITWPQSVARHPAYMKLLARFDRVWAVSRASRDELLGFWRWQGIERLPPVDVIPLGADFAATARVTNPAPRTTPPLLLCVGIIEPRKNQSLLLEACAPLWARGVPLELHIVGRVNPHFGEPIVAEIKALRRHHRQWLYFHEGASDAVLTKLYAGARATAFPTLTEGCGLPLLESLWSGVPCVHSDIPVLRENGEGGGCVAVAPDDAPAWTAALLRIATDDSFHAKLVSEASTRPLPTWAGAADILARALHQP